MSHRIARRAVIAGCCAFALLTAMVGGAAAQSRPAVGAIRVDVAPLRANAGDPTAAWVGEELPRRARSGAVWPCGAEGRDAHRADRRPHAWAEQGRPRLGQHQRSRDGRGRRAASAGDVEILGVGDRSRDNRAIQSPPCFGGRAGAGVLDRARFLTQASGSPTPPLAPAPTRVPRVRAPRASAQAACLCSIPKAIATGDRDRDR